MPGSRPMGGGPVLQIQIVEYRRYQSGALEGFATVETPSGYVIHGIAIFRQAGKRWCGLPTKPRLSKGKATESKQGGYITDPVVEIPDRQRKDAFDRAVLAALDRYREEARQ